MEVPVEGRKRDDGLAEVWWDQTVATPTKLEGKRPHMVIVDPRSKQWFMVDFFVPVDPNVSKKEKEKRSKYRDLATEVGRMNPLRVKVVSMVVAAQGIVSKELLNSLKMLRVGNYIWGLQTVAVIATAAILKVLSRKSI